MLSQSQINNRLNATRRELPVAPVTQLKADNLIKISKRIDETINRERTFYAIHLIFANAQAAKKFKDDYYKYAEHAANKPQLQILYYYSSDSKDRILEAPIFINTDLYELSRAQDSMNNGNLILEELKKHLDISAIPSVFYDCKIMQEISDEKANQLLQNKREPDAQLKADQPHKSIPDNLLQSARLAVPNSSSNPSNVSAIAARDKPEVKQCMPYPVASIHVDKLPMQPPPQPSIAQDKERQNLLAELARLRAENAALHASIPANAKQAVCNNVLNEDKATLKSMLDYFFDQLSKYPDKSSELLRRITTDYRETQKSAEKNIEDIINFAFVGSPISDVDKQSLCTDLCDIHKITKYSAEQLKLKGRYTANEIAKMVYDVSIDLVLQNVVKNSNNVTPKVNGMAAMTEAMRRSSSPVHKSRDVQDPSITNNSTQAATQSSTVFRPNQ